MADPPVSIGDGEDGIVFVHYKRVVIIRVLSRIFRYFKVMWIFKSILATDQDQRRSQAQGAGQYIKANIHLAGVLLHPA